MINYIYRYIEWLHLKFILFLQLFLDEVQQTPVKIPVVKPDTNKANPKIGVGALGFSPDCKYLYTKNGMYIKILISI